MRNLITITLLIYFACLPASGQVQPKPFTYLEEFPELQETVEYFFINYQPEEFQKNGFYQFRFARKPDGWFVYSESFRNGELESDYEIQLWDRKTGFLQKDSLRYLEGEINAPDNMQKYLGNTMRYNFSVHPFYGYTAWDQDVISIYRKLPIAGLSQNEIYGISKAYANQASNLFWAHMEYSDPESVKATSARRSDVRKFRKYSLISSHYVSVLDADYITRVGLADLKRANDVMARWYELELFGWKKAASNLLQESLKNGNPLYEPFWESASAWVLKDLDPDAILFTVGDNDTYPYLYQQAVNKLRRDVLIINLSLLNDPEYFLRLADGFLNSPGMEKGLSDQEWKILATKQIYAGNDTSFYSVLHERQIEDISEQLRDTDQEQIHIDFGYYRLPYTGSGGGLDTLVILNATNRQVAINQFILMNILYSQFSERPVYFTKPMSRQFSWLFDQANLLDEGFVIRLTSQASEYEEFNYGYYNKTHTDRIIADNPLSFPDKKYPARMEFYQLIIEMESRKISEAIRMEPSEDNIKLLMDFLNKYPPQLTGISLHYFNMIYTLLNLPDKREIAEMFLKAYMVELEFEIRGTVLTDSDPGDFNKLRYLNFIIDSVIRSEISPEIPDFYENLSSYQRSIQNKLRQMPEIRIR